MQRFAYWTLVAIYLLSFLFVGAVLNVRGMEISSIQMALMGWLGPIQLQFAWYANPFLIAGFILAARKRAMPALCCSLLAALLSLNTISLFSQGLMMDARPFFAKATELGLGAYLWLISIWGFLAFVVLSFKALSPNSGMQPRPASGAADAGR